ncbi:MAG: hypothetical protein E6I03_01430 [Chloroflexi bacterium]|nr:MAG: hypothetical protein E6I03_01430 [Chloroflexota bacterium]
MPHESRFLDCCDCDQSFPFSIAQQRLYAAMGYDQPKRCPACKRSIEKSRGPVAAVEVHSQQQYPLNAVAPRTENRIRHGPMEALMYSAWSTEQAAR